MVNLQVQIHTNTYEVYASEEEKKKDVNNLQKEFKKKINAYVDSDIDTNADAYMNMDSDAYTEVDTYIKIDANMDMNANINMNANMDAYTDLRMDANVNMDTDSKSVDNNEIFNNTFVDWNLAIEHIEKHDIENGFEVSCEYHSQKKANMEDNYEYESIKINWP
ncbi:228_t:CDS:2 [Cetraspora pellucida]|uniref:228_t:CDS:1 n=1 Tax=Cetraspora pellucida TaxID=1433469 RepID=A0A9N9FIG9_9GLOM|nr:228_t:CDS:2 [Cetraspora pellucida]